MCTTHMQVPKETHRGCPSLVEGAGVIGSCECPTCKLGNKLSCKSSEHS